MQNKNELLRQQILRMSGVNTVRCMRCGKCTATCPSFNEMEFHPHQFVYMIDSGEIEPLLRSEAIYKCLTCFACAERCPRGVEPAKLIEAVRLTAIRRKDGNRLNSDDIPSLIDDDIPQQAIMSAMRKYGK